MQCSSQDSKPSQGRAMQGYHGSSTREVFPHFVHGEESNTLTVKHGGTSLHVGNVNTVHVGDIIHNHVSESVQNQEDCYRSSSYREMEVDAKIEPRINEPVTTEEDGAGEADPRILQRLQKVFSSCHNPGKWEKNQKMCRELVSLFEHQGHGSLQKIGFGSVHFFVRVKLGPDHDAFLRACSDGILSRGLTKLLVTPELKKAAGVKLRVRLEVKETSNRNNISAPAGVPDSYTMPKARKTHSCTQCTYATRRSRHLKRHLSRRHGEGQSRGRELSPERTTSIRTAKQSIITSVPECQRALRKPRVTRRMVSSDSDSSESVPDVFIIPPSHSRTLIDEPKKKKTRIGPTPNDDSNKKKIVHLKNNSNGSSESAGLGCKRSIIAPIGVNNRPVYQPKKEKEPNAVDSSLNEEIPEDAPPTVEYVFCTACGTHVDPLDRKTFFCHPALSVVICKGCLEYYNSGPWKQDRDGIEEECRWCGLGGSIACCDFCCKSFCKPCIMRNLGRAEWSRTLSKKKWKCYVCEPAPLKELIAKCRALLAWSVKTEKKEKEKANVSVQKKVVKAPKKEKMQDEAIAEEFLQYLVGNISNRALFMTSLVRLNNEVPDMQKLQMNLSLKHIGEVKTVLGDFEACVKKHLHGDAHKSDSALGGIDPEDCERPERKSKSQMEERSFKTEKKEESAGEDVVNEESALDTAEGDGVDDNTKPRRRRLSRKKKKGEPEKMDLRGLKRKLATDSDGDGERSKRSKKKAQKKAKEYEDGDNSERQNGTGGVGGSEDGKNGGDEKKKNGKGQDEGTKKSHPLLITSSITYINNFYTQITP